MVSIGIDTHKATLAVSAVDELGRQRAARTFSNDPRGHACLLSWAQCQPAPRRVGIEGAGSFGAALAEVLVAAGEVVVEVPAQFTDRERRSLLPHGKSDPAMRWPSPASPPVSRGCRRCVGPAWSPT